MLNSAAPPRSSAAGRGLIVALVAGISVACFFRVPILNGFSHLFGDALDGRIETSILEHWFDVFRGYEKWNQVAYFYPVRDSLGYNDGYFLYGVIYSLFRAVGLDPFVSSELVNICIHYAGFIFFYLFARRVAALSFGLSLLGATIFTVANGLYLQTGQTGHVQLFTVSFTPLLALLGWGCARALKRGAAMRAAIAGSAAALLYGAWLITGYYMAWFTTLFGCLLGLAAALVWLAGRRAAPALPRTASGGRLPLWPLAVAGLVFVLGLLPFLRVYLPKAHETGMHPVAAMMEFSPSILDLLHIGPGNYLFGWLDRAITATLRPGFSSAGEHVIGFSPVLLLLSLAGAALVWRRAEGRGIFGRALSIAFIVSLVIVVHVGSHTVWLLVYRDVPGAGAVRTVTRYVLLLLVPAILLAMQALVAIRARGHVAIAAVLGVVLVAEQFSAAEPAHLDRAQQLRFLAAVPPIPAGCTSFFLRDSAATPDMAFGAVLRANVDAMMIAEVKHIPTLNGAASFHPEGDDLFFFERPGYLSRVANEAHRSDIVRGLCGYDPARNAWLTSPLPKIAVTPGRTVLLGTEAGAKAPQFIGWGWSDPEPGGVWTLGPAAELTVELPPALIGQPARFTMDARSLVTPAAPPPQVLVFANGKQVAEWHPGGSAQDWSAIIPAGTVGQDGALQLRFEIHSPRSPQQLDLSGDPRELGMHVIGFTFNPAPEG